MNFFEFRPYNPYSRVCPLKCSIELSRLLFTNYSPFPGYKWPTNLRVFVQPLDCCQKHLHAVRKASRAKGSRESFDQSAWRLHSAEDMKATECFNILSIVGKRERALCHRLNIVGYVLSYYQQNPPPHVGGMYNVLYFLAKHVPQLRSILEFRSITIRLVFPSFVNPLNGNQQCARSRRTLSLATLGLVCDFTRLHLLNYVCGFWDSSTKLNCSFLHLAEFNQSFNWNKIAQRNEFSP